MIKELYGKVVKGLGGLYETRVSEDGKIKTVASRAKGVLKRGEEKVLIGDNVRITVDESTPDGIVISEILPRKNAFIRPPMANLDYLFMVFSAKKPAPVLETVDKLVAIAEHNSVIPVIVVTKCELDPALSAELATTYNKVGIDTFVRSGI